jgi:hypothetical protein
VVTDIKPVSQAAGTFSKLQNNILFFPYMPNMVQPIAKNICSLCGLTIAA